MKRIILLLFLCVVATVATFAYDLTGKTFRGTMTIENGVKVTTTYHFKANNRMSATLAITGQKTESDNNMRWELGDDVIKIYDSYGDALYLSIEDKDGKTVLIHKTGYGPIVYKEVHPIPSKSSITKKRK